MRPIASTGPPGNPCRPIGSDRKRLIDVIYDPPVDPPQQQQQQQHSSSHLESNANNVQDKPITFSSQMRPTAGRPGNPNTPIGSDRKRLIGVINEAPIDPSQQQYQQQQQHSGSHPENPNSNFQQVPTSSSSQSRPTASTGRPGNPYRQIGSDRKRLIGVINEAPVDPLPRPPQQQQQQHSSSQSENSSNNMKQVSTSRGSHRQQMSSTGHPGNNCRRIGSDGRKLIGVLNDAPDDPPPKPPQ